MQIEKTFERVLRPGDVIEVGGDIQDETLAFLATVPESLSGVLRVHFEFIESSAQEAIHFSKKEIRHA